MVSKRYQSALANFAGRPVDHLVNPDNESQMQSLLEAISIGENIERALTSINATTDMMERSKRSRDKNVRATAARYQEKLDYLENYVSNLREIQDGKVDNESILRILIDLEIIREV